MKIIPSYNSEKFTCPHCQAVAQQWWFDRGMMEHIITNEIRHIYYDHRSDFDSYQQGALSAFIDIIKAQYDMGRFIPTGFSVATCAACKDISLWVDKKIVYPSIKTTPLAHPDMPPEILFDYDEAKNIAQASPRGAAALLRLCVQKLCKHLGEPGKNINDDIGAMVKKGLPPEIQQALDIVRVIGNNAVHPGELSSEDVQEVTATLFELVNHIVEERISRPKKLSSLFSSLPDTALAGIANRDKSKQP